MGRGSSGIKGPGEKNVRQSRPSYFGETEKAVKLRISVEDYDLERTFSREVWVPKSQLSSDGRPGQWITDQKAQQFYQKGRTKSQYEATWTDANGKSFSAGKTEKEQNTADRRTAAFNAGKSSYNELLALAKRRGVKVRVGMKRSTILRKMEEAGIKV